MDDSANTDHHAYLLQAQNWIERGRFDLAESAISKGLALQPDDQGLLFVASQCAYLQDDYEQAQELAERVLSAQPEHLGARRVLAAVASQARDYAEAERLLLEILRANPADPDIIADYGMLMLRTLHLDKAQQLAARALQHDPENQRALVVAAISDVIMGRGRQQALAELLRLHPDERDTLAMLINALANENRLAEAQRVAEALVRIDPRAKDAIETVRELRYARHWSMKPLWPLQRFGWGGVIGLWVVVVLATRSLRGVVPDSVLLAVSLTYVVFCLYSWVWPSLLRKILFREVK